jgi:hypothetical protein
MTLLIATAAAPAADANLESTIQQGSAVTLPGGHELYFYVAATAGGEPIEALSWLEGQDLAVDAAPTSDQVVSIAHGRAAGGSYVSGSPAQTTAAVAVDGYAVTQVYTAQAQRRAHESGRPERAIKGAGLTLRFKTTEAEQLTLVLVGAQGTGAPKLTGIKSERLQDATFGEQASETIASAAVYAAQLRPGHHKLRVGTTSYIPNGGTALGAVVYVLTPLPTEAKTVRHPRAVPIT